MPSTPGRHHFAALTALLLEGARLVRADLQGASLDDADLQGASLKGANLHGASLEGADLRGARLARADLRGASLDRADLCGASLSWAQLLGASLNGAYLQGTRLAKTQLQGTSLEGAHLEGASFFDALVWRACTGNHINPCSGNDVKTDGMLVTKEIITGAQWPCPGDEEALCEWSEESFESLQREIKSVVPAGKRREKALIRIEALNPEPRETDHIAEFWDHLKNDSELKAEEPVYIARAKAWEAAGCGARGAPYVVTSLAKWLEIGNPFPKDSPYIAKLAAAFLADKCAGARGILGNTRTTLQKLTAQGAPPQFPQSEDD